MRVQKGGYNQDIGGYGETVACRVLLSRGYTIVARNFRVRGGEIDIVAEQRTAAGITLCFIEVKTRQRDDGSAERATSRVRILRLHRVALLYCLFTHRTISDYRIAFLQISVFLTPALAVRIQPVIG